MSACDILVIANLNMDLILEQKNSQQTSRKRYADSFTLSPGGNGYNEAVAAARMGATVALAGMIGQRLLRRAAEGIAERGDHRQPAGTGRTRQ